MSFSMPSRNELRARIMTLCSGSVTREEIATWAVNIIRDGHIRPVDRIAWGVLTALGSIDLRSADRAYLYERLDFLAWHEDLCKDE